MFRALFLGYTLAVSSLCNFSSAADRFWIDAGGGPFTFDSNWATTSGGAGPASVPTVADNAIFDQAGIYTVTVNQDVASDLLDIDAGSITFESFGGTRNYDLTSGGADASIFGNLSLGTLGSSSETAVNLIIGDDLSVRNGVLGIFQGSDVQVGDRVAVGTSLADGSIITDESTFDFGGLVSLGATGQSGTLRLGSNSVGVISGRTELARSSTSNSKGRLDVLFGASLTTADLWVGEVIGSTTTGYEANVKVDNNSSLLMTGAADLIVGDSSNPNVLARVEVLNSSTFTTGTGNATIQNTGVLEVTDGTFTSKGPLIARFGGQTILDGGTLNAEAGLDASDGVLAHRDGKLTVSGGSFSPNLFLTQGGDTYVLDGSQADDTPRLVLEDGLSDLTSPDFIIVGQSNQAEFEARGGSQVSAASVIIGDNSGSNGKVTITGSGSEFIFLQTEIGGSGTGSLEIRDGGRVTSELSPAIGARSAGDGQVIVNGVGSTWEISGNSSPSLYVGGTGFGARGNGALKVENSGVVNVDDQLKIWSPGEVTLDGGGIVTQTLNIANGGAFNFIAGTLTINDGIAIGNDPSGVFPGSFSADLDQHLDTNTITTVAIGKTLALNGGSLTTSSLSVNGSFVFNSGTLELTGGSVTGLSQLTVPTNGTLRATGVYGSLPVSAATGSEITATGDLTLGDGSNPSGFYSNGHIHLADETLTLKDANDAVLDSGASVMLGNAGTGELDSQNGLTLDFGGNIAGFGTLDTPNDPTKPLINNGHIAGNSSTEQITLTGYVKGVGTLDNFNITGTDAPGFSPATVIRGSGSYNGTLEIEIGGTALGDFDRIEHILGAGFADLGGTLDVSLINGFVPDIGDSFGFLFAASGFADTFDSLNLPNLGVGKEWLLNPGGSTVFLEVRAAFSADFDTDGDVDGGDFLKWQRGESPMPLSASDLAEWRANYGAVASSAASAAVPEPSTVWLALLASLALGGKAHHRF